MDKQGKKTSFKTLELARSLDQVIEAFDRSKKTGEDVFEILGIYGLAPDEKQARLRQLLNLAQSKLSELED